jgi:hypothetical protein
VNRARRPAWRMDVSGVRDDGAGDVIVECSRGQDLHTG